MSHPFDATLKEIVQAHAADFVPVFGLPAGMPITPLNVDLSTLSAATDVVLGFGDPLAEIADVNFQSGPDPDLDRRILLYSSALHYRFAVPIRSLLILFRPAALTPHLASNVTFAGRGTRLQFSFEVIRLWEEPADRFLHGGLGLLPLAPLCQLPAGPLEDGIASVIRQIDQRLNLEAASAYAAELMTAAYFMTGARLDFTIARRIFRGVARMIESTTYQGVLDEGRLEGALRQTRRVILRQGQRQFGAPDPTIEATVNAVDDLPRLERMADAVLTATTWQELLATQ